METASLELLDPKDLRVRKETLALVGLLGHRELTGSMGTGDLWGPRGKKESLATKVVLGPAALLVLKVLKATPGHLGSLVLLASRVRMASRESLATLGTTARRETGGYKEMLAPPDSLDCKVLLANLVRLAHRESKGILDSLE